MGEGWRSRPGRRTCHGLWAAGRLPNILNKQLDCRADKSLPEHPYRPERDSQTVATSLLPLVRACMRRHLSGGVGVQFGLLRVAGNDHPVQVLA